MRRIHYASFLILSMIGLFTGGQWSQARVIGYLLKAQQVLMQVNPTIDRVSGYARQAQQALTKVSELHTQLRAKLQKKPTTTP